MFQAKVVYIGINALVLAIGLNKLYSVGLLPFSPSDWIDLIPRQTVQNTLIFFSIYLHFFLANGNRNRCQTLMNKEKFKMKRF